jgi:DNA phosphorothioation-associated putative methyltransferase
MARLSERGIEVSGWDPVHRPDEPPRESDVVLCAYVLNVIADPRSRMDALRNAWSLARYALVLAVRPEWEADQLLGVAHGDGVVTTKGTFQRFFTQDEARALLESITGQSPVAVAPGIFFVFRDAAEAQHFRAKRVRESHVRASRTRVEAAWTENRELLEELVDFYLVRGRSLIPEDDPKLHERLVSAFGSARAGWRLALPLVARAELEAAEARARDDLLVWLALEAFTRRPRWSELAPDLQADLRAHFGSYKDSCAQADELLFGMADERRLDEALRTVPFGKILPDAVYVHADYLSELPPLVRVYVGSGRALVGDVDGVTLVKMSRRERRISYLSYPDFERDPHPSLASSLRVDLRTFHVRWRSFEDSANPPVLHRKETMVPASHPTRDRFSRLTKQEERAGLLSDPTRIGTRAGWEEALRLAQKSLRGHRLVPAKGSLVDDPS